MPYIRHPSDTQNARNTPHVSRCCVESRIAEITLHHNVIALDIIADRRKDATESLRELHRGSTVLEVTVVVDAIDASS